MTTLYPTSLDTTTQLKNNASDVTVSSPAHTGAHVNVSDALIAIEAELGTNPKGTHTSVKNKLDNFYGFTPAANQIIQPTGDFTALGLRANITGATTKVFEIRNSSNTVLASITKAGIVDAVSLKVSGTALASTHLADASDLIKNSSPTITTPSITGPTFTGTPVAPTAAVDTNTGQVANCAFVIAQAYAKPASPAFTGIPVAPTAPGGTNNTQIATTAFALATIAAWAGDIPTGVIVAYGGATAPNGFVFCDGTTYDGSLGTYVSLWNVIGNGFGGSGQSGFKVPDLRGRLMIGKGTHVDVNALAKSEGAITNDCRPSHSHATYTVSTSSTHTHTGSTSNDGAHTHNYNSLVSSDSAQEYVDITIVFSISGTTSSSGAHTHTFTTDVDSGHTHTVASIGSGGELETPSYLVTNYIIRL